MTFGGEVHHHVGMLLLKQVVDGLAVTDVRLHETEVGLVHDTLQRGQVSGIGQLVHADNTILRVLVQHIENEVAADKTGAAGADGGHSCSSSKIGDGILQPRGSLILLGQDGVIHAPVDI